MSKARRTSTLSVCLVAAAAIAALESRQAAQPAAWVAPSRGVPANFAGKTLPAAASGRNGVEMRFFDKIAEALGLKKSAESEAASSLKDLTKSAKAQALADLKDLKSAREGARDAMKSMSAAMATLRMQKDKAMDDCEVDWNSDSADWDASLKNCAAPVLESAESAKKLLAELKTANSELISVCDRTEANSVNRTKTAQAVVAELEPEAQESLAAKVTEASQAISEGAGLRAWAFGKADLVDLEREIAASVGETTIDVSALIGSYREKRSARLAVEKEAAVKKAAADAAAAAKASAAAVASSSSSAAAAEPAAEEEGNPAALLGLLVAVAVATFAFSKGQLPDLKALSVKAPSVASISMPSMPKMPSMSAMDKAAELPREAETKNKKEDLEVKITKGELLGELN